MQIKTTKPPFSTTQRTPSCLPPVLWGVSGSGSRQGREEGTGAQSLPLLLQISPDLGSIPFFSHPPLDHSCCQHTCSSRDSVVPVVPIHNLKSFVLVCPSCRIRVWLPCHCSGTNGGRPQNPLVESSLIELGPKSNKINNVTKPHL